MGAAQTLALRDVVLEVAGRRLLDGLTDHIHPGQVTAVLGNSGSGKTTLLRLLNRFEEPTAGTILFNDRPLPEYNVHELRRRVGLVAQHPTMLTDSVAAELAVAAPQIDSARCQSLLTRVGLTEIELDRVPASLSGGEQQRLAFARALAVGPEVLLLDEPTSALDGDAAVTVETAIRTLVDDGLTVVLVSHDMQRVRSVADEVLVLDHGKIVERGRPSEIRYLT